MKNKPKAKSKIRVIIADDHPIFRKGLETTIKSFSFISHIAQAAHGDEVISLLEHGKYDLVLMDIKMSPMDGIQATEIIVRRFPHVKVISLSMYDDEQIILEVIKKGASGYLIKNADRQVILEALESVMAGHEYYSKEVNELLLKRAVHRDGSEIESEFELENPMVRDIIFLLCHGLSNVKIAELLFKSKRTIEFHRTKIINATGSNKMVNVLKYAIEHGILEDQILKRKWEKQIQKK